MKIRFQAGADLNKDIIVGVLRLRREPEIDFRTANDVGLRGLADFKVLEIAASDDRILVSQDFKTMPDTFARFLQKHSSRSFYCAPKYGALRGNRESRDDLGCVGRG